MDSGNTPVKRRNRPYAARLTPAERRDQLLDAALAIVVRDGIHKVSMDSVAREAGVTRPVVYGQFADTPSLQQASLDREEQAALAQVAGIRQETVGLPLVEGMLAYLEKFLAAIESYPQRWRAIFLLVDSSTPAMRVRLESARQGVIDALEQRIRTNADETMPDEDIDLLARTVFAWMWDAGRLVLDGRGEYSPQRIVAFARRTLPAIVASVGVGDVSEGS